MSSYLKLSLLIFVFTIFHQVKDFSNRVDGLFAVDEISLYHTFPDVIQSTAKIRSIKIKLVAIIKIFYLGTFESHNGGHLFKNIAPSLVHLSNFVSSGAKIFQHISTSYWPL